MARPPGQRAWTARFWAPWQVAVRPAGRSQPGSVRLRLALAFVAVALSALALVTVLIAVFSANDVAQQAGRQRTQLAQAMTTAAGATWDATGNWSRAELNPLLDAGRRIGAGIQITDTSGRVVGSSAGFDHDTRPSVTAPVLIDGRSVGTIQIRLTGTGLAATDAVLRAALWRAIAGAAALAALLAVLAALVVSRRITDPVSRLIEVAQATGRGDRSARVGDIRAPAELRNLAATFDRMADNLTRQDQLRRDMAADVAHELRTPVAVLQAGHEALIDGVVQPTPRQLGSLRDEVLRLARLVDDLYTLSSAEAAALQLSLERVDLAEVTVTAVASLTARFDAAGIVLEQRLSPVVILADAGRVHQIVLNLLGNALKFTPAGGQVTVTTESAGTLARLSVTDTGRGIPADELPKIFDRFWRGRQAGRVAGSGIGLAVVAELVRGHGGSVQVTSTPGQGTRVVVAFPCQLTSRSRWSTVPWVTTR